jgi:trehalose 6-phosphate phosphatase
VPHAFDHLEQIRELVSKSPFGLITDVDGTISKTAPTPEKARVSPLCRRYLAQLCPRLALVAAISGRQTAQVREMVGIDGMVYIGNHGLERWQEGHTDLTERAKDYPEIIEATTRELAPLLSRKGVSIENKGVSATIHYRLAPDHELAEREILKLVQNLTQISKLRIMPGKMSVNLLPAIEINKGTATLELINEYQLRGAIYLGDEVTDLDAFRVIHIIGQDLDFRGLAIAVTGPETPETLTAEADFILNGVSEVGRFLSWMVKTVP